MVAFEVVCDVRPFGDNNVKIHPKSVLNKQFTEKTPVVRHPTHKDNTLHLSLGPTLLTSLRFASTIKTKSLKLSLLVVTHIVAQNFFKTKLVVITTVTMC